MRPLPEIAADLERIARELREPVDPPDVPTVPGFTIVEPGHSVQAALDAAAPGADIRLRREGAYPGNLIIRKPVTLSTHDIELGSARVTRESAGMLARIIPTTGAPLIDILPGLRAVSLAKLTCEPAGLNDVILVGHGDSSQTAVSQQPDDITIHQVFMAAGAGMPKRGIGIHGTNVRVTRSHISGFRRGGQDTQAIAGWNGFGPITIADNYLEAAGENVMFGGANANIFGCIPSDIVLELNTITKDMAWRGSTFTVKNLVELKAGRRVQIRHNQISNMWQSGQSYAFMFTPVSSVDPDVIVEDVLMEFNDVRNIGAGMSVLGYSQEGPSQQSRGFIIRDNYFQIDRTLGVQAWFLFMGREPRDFVFEHNTIDSTSTNAILKHEGNPVQGFRFTRNLVPQCGQYGFTGNVNGSALHRGVGVGTYLPGHDISNNAFGSFPAPSNLPGNVHVPTSAITLQDGYGTGVYADYGRRPQ